VHPHSLFFLSLCASVRHNISEFSLIFFLMVLLQLPLTDSIGNDFDDVEYFCFVYVFSYFFLNSRTRYNLFCQVLNLLKDTFFLNLCLFFWMMCFFGTTERTDESEKEKNILPKDISKHSHFWRLFFSLYSSSITSLN
jgi:hypothetical protein